MRLSLDAIRASIHEGTSRTARSGLASGSAQQSGDRGHAARQGLLVELARKHGCARGHRDPDALILPASSGGG
jgi:hypothetical protein